MTNDLVMTLLPLGFSLLHFPRVICLKCFIPANWTLYLRLVVFSLLSIFLPQPVNVTMDKDMLRPSALATVHGIFFTWTPLSESSLLTLVKVQSLWKRKQNSFTLKQFWGFRILIKWQKSLILKCFFVSWKTLYFKKWSSCRSPWSSY